MNVLCIAGFLGSGKTTVLLQVARALTDRGARVAVIENEIGEVGLDGDYVREQGLPVRELFGGCICCTLQSGLVETLAAVQDAYAPEWVLIEPTGLAAPADMLGLIEDNARDLDGIRVLTIVDAERWPMLIEVVEPLVTSQIESADVVAVNKVDAVDAGELETVLDDVYRIAGDTPLVQVSAAAEGDGMQKLLQAVL
jgi:G3E family GTPase